MAKFKMGDRFTARVNRKDTEHETIKIKGVWTFKIRDKNGNVRDKWTIENLIVNQGLEYNLDVSLANGAQQAAWFVGLIQGPGAPTLAPADTLASKAWTEETGYDELTRQAWTGVRTNQTITNSAAPATFTASGAIDVAGAFLASNNTKGGTTGILFNEGAFANRSLSATETIEITAAVTAADA